LEHKKPLILLIAFIVSFAWNGKAQQGLLSSLAYKDKYRAIPAFAGMEGTIMGSFVYRNHWQGFPGNPKTLDLSLHSPYYRWGAAFGLLMGQDKLGLEQHSYIKPSIHKVINLGKVLFSAGIQAEFYWLNLDLDAARTPEGDYPGGNIDHNDPRLANQTSDERNADLGISVFLLWEKYQFGVSLEKLFQSHQSGAPIPWTNRRNLKLLVSRRLDWNDIAFELQCLVHSDFVRLQTEIFSGIEYNGNIFGGVHLRGYNGNSLESIGFSLGLRLSKQIQMAYCHEFNIGSVSSNFNQGNQEIGLFYNFGKAFGLGKAPRIIYNPRYSD
jgi:type IX secretion system PorP/SprF family membrane protein